ncbi:MAG TPA: peptide deformylase [Pirellulaceae bacterium]|nr:peptide deformylase [Pirellulaceae bacterium]
MLKIVQFPHPTLRHRSKPLRRVDQKIKEIVAEMFELMYAAKGVGLAANQVGLPFQLFVVNTAGDPLSGEELVFINPILSSPQGQATAEEGCLSLPGVFGNVVRAERIHVAAYDRSGQVIDRTIDDMLARVIQHEFDHVQGVMFFERMNPLELKLITSDLDRFEREFEMRRLSGEIPPDDQIIAERNEWEKRYCAP